MGRRDLVGGLGFLILALIGVEESLRLPLGSWQNPAPGFFPFLLSLALAALSLTLLIGSFKKPGAAPQPDHASRSRKVWGTLAGLFAFYAFMEPLGFLISSFLVLVFLLRAIAMQRWRLTVGISAGTALASYLVFDRLLKLPLPRGMAGF
jgi:hypothetical protein